MFSEHCSQLNVGLHDSQSSRLLSYQLLTLSFNVDQQCSKICPELFLFKEKVVLRLRTYILMNLFARFNSMRFLCNQKKKEFQAWVLS